MNILNYYEPFEHFRDDKSNSAPVHDDGLTVGVEFELGSSHDDVGLYEMVEDGVLQTADSGEAYIQLELEAQSDVEYELVFNGDYVEDIKMRLEYLDDYGVLDNVSQHHECSAHIHINREYIEDDLGLDEYDFYKATEFLAPFIYAISGRNDYAWDEWTPSRISRRESLVSRAKLVDDVEPKSYRGCGRTSARYDLCNLANDATIEVRGFSSYYKDVELTKTYIDVVAYLIPNVALAMQNKSYKREFWRALEQLNAFIDDHAELLERFNLAHMVYDVDAIRAKLREDAFNYAIQRREHVNEYLRRAETLIINDELLDGARHVLNALNEDRELKVEKLPLERDALLKTINEIKALEAKLFKNRVWSA